MSVFEKYRDLWKKTFGDSDKYLDIIESTYFRPGRILVDTEGDEVAAGMLTIPYSFAGGELRGLYMCGLCTSVEYREQGIMSRLIAKAAHDAKAEGFDFLFLIPDGEELRRYYSQRGFVNGAFRQVVSYSAAHDFVVDKEDVKINFFDDKIELRNRLCAFINSFENNCIASIVHSAEDVNAVIEENYISGGKIVYAEDESNDICGVSFVEVCDAKLKVVHAYCECKNVENSMLKFMKNNFPEKSIIIYKYPDISLNGDIEPYAMFRLLNHDKVLELMAAKRLIADIKVLNADKESCTHYVSKNGGMERRECEISNLSIPSDIMDDTSLAKIIWRMPSKDKIVGDATGVSRLPSDVCLMLD